MIKYFRNIFLLSFIFLTACNTHATSYLFGEVKYQDGKLQAGNISVPKQRTQVWNTQSKFGDSVISHWSSRSLAEIKQKGKVDAPRVLLANLVSNKKVSLNMVELAPLFIFYLLFLFNFYFFYPFKLLATPNSTPLNSANPRNRPMAE